MSKDNLDHRLNNTMSNSPCRLHLNTFLNTGIIIYWFSHFRLLKTMWQNEKTNNFIQNQSFQKCNTVEITISAPAEIKQGKIQ